MRRKLFLIAAVVSIVAVLAAPSALSAEDGRNYLWRIEAGEAVVYLLGSVHILSDGAYPLPAPIERAYAETNTLVVEVDITRVDQGDMQSYTLTKALYQDGGSLKAALSAAAYDLAKQRLAEYGIDIEAVDNCRPWYLASLLAALDMQRLGYLSTNGIDQYFLRQAAQDGRRVLELESWQSQVDLMASLDEFYADELVGELAETEEVTGGIEQAWLVGDDEKLFDLIFMDIRTDPQAAALYERFYFARNLPMAAKVEEYLRTSDSYLVIVGVGHMIGERGIIALLEKAGYEVERL